MKVRTKLNLILVLVILLVALGGTVSVKDMEDVKDKALETMEASSRQSYDDSIKEQVEVVISLLSEINDAYKAGTYTLDEAKKIAADEVRQMRYGEAGYFWIDQSDGTNVVLLGSDTEGTNRMETKDAKGYQMVKEIIRVAVEDGGGYTDFVFPKPGETKPSPKRSVPTVSTLNRLTGWSVPEIIRIILILPLQSRTRYFPTMQCKRQSP